MSDEPQEPDMVGPYDLRAMTLFDYRTDHLEGEQREDAEKRPTFNYVMPLETYEDGSQRVFFEETSLTGRGKRYADVYVYVYVNVKE